MAGRSRKGIPKTEPEPEENQVEKIEGIRVYGGEIQYWVHWANYDEIDNTWEPLENLTNCHEQLKSWHDWCEGHAPMIESTASQAPKRGGRKVVKQDSPAPEPARKRTRGNGSASEPRIDSESSSISNQNGKKAKNGGRTATPMSKTPAVEADSDDEAPLAAAASRSTSAHKGAGSTASKHSRSISAGRSNKKIRLSDTPEGDAEEPETSQKQAVVRARDRRKPAQQTVEKTPTLSQPARRGTAVRTLSSRKSSTRSPIKKAPAKRTPAKKATRSGKKAESDEGDNEDAAEAEEEDEGNDKEAAETSGTYTVEEVIGMSFGKGTSWYLVKWDGYDLEECTWEESKAMKQASAAIGKFTKKYGKPTKNNPQVLNPDGKKFVKMIEKEGKE